MDSLFNTSFESTPSPHSLPSVKLKAHTYELQENNVKLKLTIVDTVGYGDQINKEDSFKSIVDYIDNQFEAYLQEELKIKRSLNTYHDNRIHVCLYFICPTGHGLKSLDLVCMKKLDSKVNIIPIIAKADTISKSELQKFKTNIMTELTSNGVHIYEFPTDDETMSDVNAAMNQHLPFAVVGSTEFVKVGNKMMRSRQYPWGTVQVENEGHCDFVKLREMLIRTNMEDMREKTHCRHYELYRKKRLEETVTSWNIEAGSLVYTGGSAHRVAVLSAEVLRKENSDGCHRAEMTLSECDATTTLGRGIVSLKSLDLVCMKKLDSKVNIIPIIAKADTISKSELQKFKFQGLVRLVSKLIECGANLNVQTTLSPFSSEQERYKLTALHCAVLGSQPGVVEILLQHKGMNRCGDIPVEILK
ncbi:septin-2 [Diaphorina citri]|uniref:Septin-2 n=1 Tax=Diaphorina citri TaxID=121845 RepID=A0A1S3CVQ2_DIACI|nr:septin-2 [Diaphorina citri]